ncbi:MAG: SRPBCC family protein [Solirubrobacteraceae bacterium]
MPCSAWASTGRDEIVEVVAGRRLGYVSLSGPPVRDYRARVDLEPAGGGTAIRWRASFFPWFPGTGWALKLGLRQFLEQCAIGLAEHAARAHAEAGTALRRADAA